MAPSSLPGVTSGPPVTPANRPAAVESGGSGGGVGGLVLSEVRGVCVAFDSPAMTETPLWVRLDDPNGPFIVSGWTIDRGRTYELDKTDTGTATVTLIDRNGSFDPTNASGPFAGKLNPRKQAAIALRNPVTGSWSTVFRGFVSRWAYDMYPTEDYATVTLELVDGMDILAGIEMAPATPIAFGTVITLRRDGEDVVFEEAEQVQHRINKVLDQAGWPGGLREIFSGNVRVQETVYPWRSAALTVIEDAADSEFPGVANFYFQRDGRATFHGRFARFKPNDANYHIATWKAGDLAAVAADSTRALIFDLEYDRDDKKIINSATATPQGIAEADIPGQLVEDESSKGTYGVHSISFENLLTKSGYVGGTSANVETKKFATYYVNNYKEPRTRVSTITFKRVGPQDQYAARLWRVMCGVDISDLIDLKTTHAGGGGFNEQFYVEGVHYSAKPLSDEYLDVELTVDVSPKAYYDSNPF